MNRIVVLEAQEFSFKGDDGREVEISKITYTEATPVDEERGKGVEILTAKASPDAMKCLREVPGVYDAIMGTSRKGRDVVAKFTALTLVKAFDFTALLASPAPGAARQ